MSHILYLQSSNSGAICANSLHSLANNLPDEKKVTLWLPEKLKNVLSTDYLEIQYYPEQSYAELLARVIKEAARTRQDLFVFDELTVLFPGTLQALRDALAEDPLTVMAIPRSNCNGQGTFHGLKNFSCNECWEAFATVQKFLKPRVYLPSALASCVCLKTGLLAEIGVLDLLYTWRHSSLNVLVEVLYQKANSYGMSAVLANRAFVYRENVSENPEYELELLASAFSGQAQALEAWHSSAEYMSDRLLSGLIAEKGRLPVVLDFSNFGTSYNGTSIAGMQFLQEATKVWPERYSFYVMISDQAFLFHELDRFPRVRRINQSDENKYYAAVIRFGQPFSWYDIQRIVYRAPVIGMFMYDCIAADSNYLSAGFERKIWEYIFQFSDIVYCISEFTKKRIRERFTCAETVNFAVARLSMDIHEYGKPSEEKKNYIFVIGNDLKHKFIAETVRTLSSAFPEQEIIVTSAQDEKNVHVRSVKGGHIDSEDFARMYGEAKCVVYPSVYEGFGLPIFHAIGSGTVLYLRDNELNRELYPFIQYNNNIIFYTDNNDLVDKMCYGMPAFSKQDVPLAEKNGKVRFVNDVLLHLEKALGNIDQKNIINRLRWFPDEKEEPFSKFKYWKYSILKKITYGKRKLHYDLKYAMMYEAKKKSEKKKHR